MSAYVIVEIKVDDTAGYEEYRTLATASVARHGGRYVSRGGQTETFEGEWSGRIVILEFESIEAARSGTTPTTTKRRSPSGCGHPGAA